MAFSFDEEQTVSYRPRVHQSWMMTKLQNLSGGRIKTQQQANTVLLITAAFLLVVAFFLLKGSGSEAEPLSQQQINEIISNQQQYVPRR